MAFPFRLPPGPQTPRAEAGGTVSIEREIFDEVH